MLAERYYSSPERRMTSEEVTVVCALAQRAFPQAWRALCEGIEERFVRTLNDGGQGSFGFCSDGSFGENASEAEYTDADGKYVSFALYLNQEDVFKEDGSRLVRWPSVEELVFHERKHPS